MTKTQKDPITKWHGDEVQPRSPGEAERDADRAEGNGVESDRDISVAQATHGSRQPRARKDDDSEEGDDADAKTAEAAEEHRERLHSGNRPPRRTL